MNMEQNIVQIPLEDIIPNRFQPRLNFDESGLKELAESIQQHGIIQPLVLRRLGNKYEIIAGERRYKAATIAGLRTVPAVISNISDNQSAEVALVENIQRKNLTPIEEAKSYRNLLDRGYLTQEQLASKMGISQSSIANKLRLLNLSQEVQEALLNEKISERHARSLLSIPIEEQALWLKKLLDNRWTVRQLDIEIKKYKESIGAIDDVPFVNLNPDIDSMIANAQDINSVISSGSAIQRNDISSINEGPDDLEEIDEETDTDERPVKMPNKFFNFLEEESVNMDINEPITPSPNKPISGNIFNLPSMEVLDFEENELDSNSLGNNDISLRPEEKVEKELVDPVNLIERLDPNYNLKLQEESGTDLKTAISMIRTKVSQMNDLGFIVDLDEVDLNDEYLITIKIKK